MDKNSSLMQGFGVSKTSDSRRKPSKESGSHHTSTIWSNNNPQHSKNIEFNILDQFKNQTNESFSKLSGQGKQPKKEAQSLGVPTSTNFRSQLPPAPKISAKNIPTNLEQGKRHTRYQAQAAIHTTGATSPLHEILGPSLTLDNNKSSLRASNTFIIGQTRLSCGQQQTALKKKKISLSNSTNYQSLDNHTTV